MKIPLNSRVLALLLATSCFGGVAQAQVPPTVATSPAGTLQQFLSGDLVPLDLKFSQMKTGWSRVNIERKGATNNAPTASAYSALEPFTAGFQRHFGQGSDVVWTQGRTVDLNGQQNLVVYRAQFPSVTEASAWLDANLPKSLKDPATSDEKVMDFVLPLMRQFLDTVPLRASLVKVDTIDSLDNVQSFQYERAFAAFGKESREQFKVFNRGREGQRDASSRNSLEFLANGFKQYLLDYDDVLPPLANWDAANKALQPYMKSEIKLAQPDQKIHTNPLLSGKKLAHLKAYADSLVVFYSDADQSGNRWVVYLSGNVQEINANQWPQLKKSSRLP